jgi:hypothetical protein
MAKFEALLAHEKELSAKAAADKKLAGNKDLRLEAEQTSWLHSRGIEVSFLPDVFFQRMRPCRPGFREAFSACSCHERGGNGLCGWVMDGR